jgi:D-alanyl-D-alanine dipeptidase
LVCCDRPLTDANEIIDKAIWAAWNVGIPKREGDGKSPAGIFRITSLFGYGDFESKMPYQKADSTVFCVDDATSAHYNRVLSLREVARDWTSAETMRRKDHQYRLGAVVAYNTEPVTPGAGSCIFLHIWRSPGSGTAGCTAMTEVNLLSLVRTLDPANTPTLIQMPEAELQKMRLSYLLP